MTPSGLPASQSQEYRSLPWSYGYMHVHPGHTCTCRVTCSLVSCQSAPRPGSLCSWSTGAQQQQTMPSHGTGKILVTEQLGTCCRLAINSIVRAETLARLTESEVGPGTGCSALLQPAIGVYVCAVEETKQPCGFIKQL